ncbi:MAG: ROK family protein [Gillisia sp.]
MQKVSLGIDMGGTRIKMGLVNVNGEILKTHSLPADSKTSLKKRLEDLKIEINTLLENDFSLGGIGVAFPGIVNHENKKILSEYVKYPDAHLVDLEGWAEHNWGVPLILENDARAALVGEWQYGAGKGTADLVMVTLGTGVGSAVLLDEKILRGRNFLAGNLGGHMSVNMYGDICNCGNIGCLESESSTWALEKVKTSPNYESSTLKNHDRLNFEKIFLEAENGDKLAGSIKENSLRAWGVGIINLIHAFDPERVIVGGGIMKSKNEILPYLRKMVEKHSWVPGGNIDIVAAEQTQYAGILGMCFLLNKGNKF